MSEREHEEYQSLIAVLEEWARENKGVVRYPEQFAAEVAGYAVCDVLGMYDMPPHMIDGRADP